MKSKRIATLLLTITIAFSLSGCSDVPNIQKVTVEYTVCSPTYDCNSAPVLFILPKEHQLFSINLVGAKGGAFMGSMADAMPHVPTGLGAYDDLPWEEIAEIVGNSAAAFTESTVRSQGGVIITNLIPDQDESDDWYKFSRIVSGFVPVKYACEFYDYDNNKITAIEIPVGTTSLLLVPEIASIKVTSVIDFDPNLEYSKGTIGGKISYDMAKEVQGTVDVPTVPDAGVATEPETNPAPTAPPEEVVSNSSNPETSSSQEFSILGKWKSTGDEGVGQAQPGAIIVFAESECNLYSPRDTYALYKDGDTLRLDATGLLGGTLSCGVSIVDNDHLELRAGSTVTYLQRVG